MKEATMQNLTISPLSTLPLLRDGLDQYCTVSGDERVYLLELPEARGDTIGARQHPGAAAHRAAANCLAKFLRSVL